MTSYSFAFDPLYRRLAWVFGVSPDTTWVRVDAEMLRVRFGPWRVATPLTNIDSVAVTGPYRRWRTAGPARLDIHTRGLTFATNPNRGVEIQFGQPIPGIEPTHRLEHPDLTVTVTDCDGLARAINETRRSR